MTKLKVAIVGLGHIGKRHLALINRDPRFELVAVCDANTIAIEQIVPKYNTLTALLDAHEDLDLVSVCSPNHLHYSMSIEALQARVHVLCEKPMALQRRHAESMISEALQQSKSIFCVMQNRYSSISQWLKSVVDSNLLGEIYLTNVTGYWNRDHRYYGPDTWKGSLAQDGGSLFTQFAHYVDMLYWLLGDLHIESATFRNYNHQDTIEFEDSGNVQFGFGTKGVGNFQYTTSTWDRNFESSLTLVGQNGTIKVGGQYMDKIVYCHIKDYEMPDLTLRNNDDNMAMVYDNIYNVLNNNDKVMTNAMDGMKVVDIIEKMYKFRVQ